VSLSSSSSSLFPPLSIIVSPFIIVALLVISSWWLRGVSKGKMKMDCENEPWQMLWLVFHYSPGAHIPQQREGASSQFNGQSLKHRKQGRGWGWWRGGRREWA
jgi:hypothetical protein